MRIIGLCGRSGSGKSLFANYARSEGLTVLDCDRIYNDLVSHKSDCLNEIAQHFGSDAIKDNALNRRYLAPIVFSDKEKLNLLNQITHKYIKREIENILSKGKEDDIFIIDAPTLFESGLQNLCEKIIAVITGHKESLKRITERDNITVSEAELRLKNQYTNEFLMENCHIIITNETTLEDFKSACLKAIEQIKESRL